MSAIRGVVEDALRMHPAPGRGVVALRAALAVGVPLTVVTSLGVASWGLYCVFGAFAAVYGGAVAYRGRWRHQAFVGTLLVGATTSGAAAGVADARAWISIAVAVAWGVVGARCSDRQRWVPPGPLFLVFAAGACGARPTEPAEVGAAALVALATAVWAVGLGVVEEAWRRADREPHHGRSAFALRPDRFRMHLVRVAVVVAVSGVVATALGIPHPYWAMVAAVAPISVPRLQAQASRGLQRATGTLVGIALAAALLALDLPVAAVVATAVVLQSLTELVVTRNYALAMVFITPLALLMGTLGHPEPVGTVVLARLVETLLGTAVGLGAAWLTRARTAPTG